MAHSGLAKRLVVAIVDGSASQGVFLIFYGWNGGIFFSFFFLFFEQKVRTLNWTEFRFWFRTRAVNCIKLQLYSLTQAVPYVSHIQEFESPCWYGMIVTTASIWVKTAVQDKVA